MAYLNSGSMIITGMLDDHRRKTSRSKTARHQVAARSQYGFGMQRIRSCATLVTAFSAYLSLFGFRIFAFVNFNKKSLENEYR